MAHAVAFFAGAHLKSPQMFTQRIADQRGTIPLGSACGLICGVQKFLAENNLNCFHLSILFHKILHMLIRGHKAHQQACNGPHPR
jgi:hypothetical protein